MAHRTDRHQQIHDAVKAATTEFHDELKKIRDAEADLRIKRSLILTVAHAEVTQKLSAFQVSSDAVSKALAMCW